MKTITEGTYTIQMKTPATGWRVVHTGFSLEGAVEFLESLAKGGYDKSCKAGSFYRSTLEAHHYDGGDLIEFRAVKE